MRKFKYDNENFAVIENNERVEVLVEHIGFLTSGKQIVQLSNIEEMSNMFPKTTGLKHKIWLSRYSSESHNELRIKIEIEGIRYPIIFTNNSCINLDFHKFIEENIHGKEMRKLKKFIKINCGQIKRFWNDLKGELTDQDIRKKLIKV